MIIILEFIFIFLLFSFIGYVWEVFLYVVKFGKFVNRGNLHGPWLIVYGLGGLFIYYVLMNLKCNYLELFIFGIFGCGIIEYGVSVIEEMIWKKRWWDYSNKFLNINGRVCFVSLFFFGLCSVLFVKFVCYYIGLFIFNKYFVICLFLMFIVDFVYSLYKPNVGENVCIDVDN